MYYAIMGSDKEGTLEKRMASRPDHVARLKALLEQGRLLLAGPHPAIDSEDPGDAGYTGSLIIAAFDSLEAAREWANEDPYVAAGVYRDVVVKPFRQALP